MNIKKIQNTLWLTVVIVLLSINLSTIEEYTSFVSNNTFNTSISASANEVILGGQTVGFDYQGDGVLVVSKQKDYQRKKDYILVGDIIKSINNINIYSSQDISSILNAENSLGKELDVCVKRNNKIINLKITPELDVFSNSYKLGVWVKDNVSGIGTITYINPKTGKFGALGHAIVDGSTGKILDVKEGKVYDCSIVGIAKGARGAPGELHGVISKRVELGMVEKNTDFGIYGTIENENFKETNKLIRVGGRNLVRPGKAVIYSCIEGGKIKSYDIQIIKTNYQSISDEKSLVFKVTDKRLIEKTGGIVQGMSGSPIVQDGKLVGAVTHVFLNDSTKGFGLYIDWMM